MSSYSALLKSYARQVITSRRPPSSNLPPSLASRVRADLFRLQRMSLPPQGTCELFGYTITYLGEGELRFLSQEIFGWGAYMFKSHSREPVIFDCGSNIGMSVLFFKAVYPHARITAFEPDPGTYKVLNRNIEQSAEQKYRTKLALSCLLHPSNCTSC
jgi:hypothetical protein